MPNLSLAAKADSVLYPDAARETEREVAALRMPSAAAQAFVNGYRLHGSSRGAIDPLGMRSPDLLSISDLDPRHYGLEPDQAVAHVVRFGTTLQAFTVAELVQHLRASYCGSMTLESGHVRASSQREWLYARFESRIDLSAHDAEAALRVLHQLVAAETFERFQRASHPRGKQFSLEGCESLIPLLNTLIEASAQQEIEDVVLGMAHRGRLNALRNVLELPAPLVLSLLSGHPDPRLAAWDLKDHVGCRVRKRTDRDDDIGILLLHNPSHLESIVPIVCGATRALQDRKGGRGSKGAISIVVHGDAAFCGQGIVGETLNLSQTRGYGTGGTLHLVLNNQIGSTVSDPHDSRSTLYCADIARAIDAPIVHVNADDPDAVVAAARIAVDYRMKFGADFVIDLVGYRRYGHFGGDDPMMTQPAMQRRIRKHRSVACLYAERLSARGIVDPPDYERLTDAALSALAEAQSEVVGRPAPHPAPLRSDAPAARAPRPVTTAVPIEQLLGILRCLAAVPQDFRLHADLERRVQGWQAIATDPRRPVDWCLAENLAYGSLLVNGFNVRLTGLDVGRGSCFHRHHVWHDQAEGTGDRHAHVPLRHLAGEQGYFSIFESPLSEESVVGFEYGYALECGRDLVVWEAQLGDFVNNAQTIVDQYISSGERKWGYANGLVLLLPHGHEGAGPEHSSAFLGRFLQLCAEDNLQVAMPSTASQLYHLLRRQALMDQRKPLVVMTPKMSLYGEPASHSTLQDLAGGEFQPLLDAAPDIDDARVTRVIVTSGKLYYDLATARSSAAEDGAGVPILRLEQLYPFPNEPLRKALSRYPLLREVVWAQEEARNHGAWMPLREFLEAALPRGVSLRYAGRPSAAPSAVCDQKTHRDEQRRVVESAFAMMAAATFP